MVVFFNTDTQGNSLTLKASYYKMGAANFLEHKKDGFKATGIMEQTNSKSRIRRLTPRECFRLMGVSETDIDKIQQSGVSNSQQYKMAGNSIVVDVMYYIFKNMFANEGINRVGGDGQLQLF